MKPSKLPTTPHRHTCMLLCLSTLRNIMHTSHHKTCHMHRGHGGISCISQSIPHIPHTCIRLIRIPYKAIPAHTKPHTPSPPQSVHNHNHITTMCHTMRHARCTGGMETSAAYLRAYQTCLIPVCGSSEYLIKLYQLTLGHMHISSPTQPQPQ